jgi:hypothetical protein
VVEDVDTVSTKEADAALVVLDLEEQVVLRLLKEVVAEHHKAVADQSEESRSAI